MLLDVGRGGFRRGLRHGILRKFWRRVDDKIKLRRRRELLRIERRQKKLARAQAQGQPEAEKMRG